MTLDVATDILYRLGFQGSADIALANTWVTVAELYQWADEAVKALSYRSGAFVTYDSSVTVAADTPLYQLPAGHVFTLAMWLDAQPLRITPVADLWALDAEWSAASGPGLRASLDAGGVGTVTLYPNPNAGGTLGQVCGKVPATIALGSSTIALPTVLQDYFSYAALAGARGKESEQAMPDMAAHFQQRMDLYEQVIRHLYGTGQ